MITAAVVTLQMEMLHLMMMVRNFDLNDLQTANTDSAMNESYGSRHENSVAVVVNPLPLIQSPAGPNDLSLTTSVNQSMTKGYVIVGDYIDKSAWFSLHSRYIMSIHMLH